jgi:hypothetical protein
MGTAVVFETRRPFLGFTLRTGLRIGGDNAMCAALAALVLDRRAAASLWGVCAAALATPSLGR